MSAFAYPQTPAPTSYLFVDGGCVRAELERISRWLFGVGGAARLSWPSLQSEFTKIFYYDALPTRDDGESDEQYVERNSAMLKLHDDLRHLNGFHVYEGDVRRARGRKDRAQQKKVDVMIAVDMLLHTFRRNMKTTTLLASDLDFAPLLYALVREGMFVTLWYPPAATNPELQSAADARRIFSTETLGALLLDGDGRQLLPAWQIGMLHVRHLPVTDQLESLDGQRVAVSQGTGHFMCEVFERSGSPKAYATHHDLRTLLLTAEVLYGLTLPNDAFAALGGRPNQ